MLPAFLTTILFSISAICANRTARTLGGVVANFSRIFIATLCLGLWSHTYGVGVAGKSFPVFFVSGIVGFGLGDLALYQALPRLGSRLSVLLVHCLAAPVAALTEWVWLGTALSRWQMVYGTMVLIGVAFALAPSEHLKATRHVVLVGIAFGVLAALGQGFGAVLSRKAYAIADQTGLSIDGITAAYQRILGGLAVAAVSFVVFRRFNWEDVLPGKPASTTISSAPRSHIWPWVLMNALAGPVLGVSCYQWALKTTPTGVVLPVVAIAPIVIIPFSITLEGERPTLRSLAGGVVAVIGVVCLSRVTPPT
jgi:drug/metabolite transporter (DMT)-like permease